MVWWVENFSKQSDETENLSFTFRGRGFRCTSWTFSTYTLSPPSMLWFWMNSIHNIFCPSVGSWNMRWTIWNIVMRLTITITRESILLQKLTIMFLYNGTPLYRNVIVNFSEVPSVLMHTENFDAFGCKRILISYHSLLRCLILLCKTQDHSNIFTMFGFITDENVLRKYECVIVLRLWIICDP